MKKLLSILLVIAVLLPCAGFAAEDSNTGEATFEATGGAWGVSLTLRNDGTYAGTYGTAYRKAEAGAGYDSYVYYSSFSGKMSELTEVNDYTYSFTLDTLEYDHEPDTSELLREGADTILYRYVEPTGVEQGNTYFLYLDTSPVSELPSAFVKWVRAPMGLEDSSRLLGFNGLYDEDHGMGFFQTGPEDGSLPFFETAASPAGPAEAPFSITQEELEREIEAIRGYYYSPGAGDERITLVNGTDGWNYSRDYTFHNGKLAFAFVFDGTEEHRLYFKDGHMIRYIDENHTTFDYGALAPYEAWAARVLAEAEALIPGSGRTVSGAGSGWLGTWEDGTGESLEIYAVAETGLSLVYHHYVEDGSFMHTDYQMEFDNAEKTVASEIGGAENYGWEYTLILNDGFITVESRYPDQIFYYAGQTSGAGGFSPLQNGSSGEDVRRVQNALIALGLLNGSADGVFGNMTENAVIVFQVKNGLDPTGVVDEATFLALTGGEESRNADQPAGQIVVPSGTSFSITQEELEREIEAIRGYYYSPGAGDERITLVNGTDGWNYSRDYTFHNGKLAFAFVFDGTEEHRLYFKDGHMIRYIDENHTTFDYGTLAPYESWASRVLAEAETLIPGSAS